MVEQTAEVFPAGRFVGVVHSLGSRCPPIHTPLLQGVRRVFMIPGAKIDRIVEVLRNTDEIEVVLCRNEQTAAFMAAGRSQVVWAAAGSTCMHPRKGLSKT